MKKENKISVKENRENRKNAVAAILKVEGTPMNRLKALIRYAGTGAEGIPEVRKWAMAMGLTKDDYTLTTIFSGWGLYEESAQENLCVVKVPIYKIHYNEEGYRNFSFDEIKTIDKRGHEKYDKQVEFYVYDRKTTWTIDDVMKAIENTYHARKATYVVRERPYVKVEGKSELQISNNATFMNRAKDDTRAAEEEARAELMMAE